MQLATDPGSAKAGQGLAQPRKWVSAGCDDRAVWGECQGSGARPYQVRFDVTDGASKCSCPSRKFPCKHVVGLMLNFASSDSAVAKSAAPAWVEEWLASRAQRQQKQQEKAESPPSPVNDKAQAQRREKRLRDMTDGVAALKVWVEDLVKTGIAIASTKGYAFFDEPARRMVDAQSPGIARRVQRLGEIAVSGGGWQLPFLQELARIHLLIRAFEKIDSLPEANQADVIAAMGVPAKAEDAADQAAVADHWQVVAQETEEQDRLRVQRTWMYGKASRRPAMVLVFAHGTTPLQSDLLPATGFEGELCFFPGNGLRDREDTLGAPADPGAGRNRVSRCDVLPRRRTLGDPSVAWRDCRAGPARHPLQGGRPVVARGRQRTGIAGAVERRGRVARPGDIRRASNRRGAGI